jgi:N-acetyl sugar amidotransferase
MNLIVISSDYPSREFLYGDVFVHTRLKQYNTQFNVRVIGFKAGGKRRYIYEGIDVHITADLPTFYDEIIKSKPDVIAAHLIAGVYIDFLIKLKIPLVIFVHGYEALSWKHRLLNYKTIGDLRYLVPYILSNNVQLKQIKKMIRYSNVSDRVQFVFVSSWLRESVEKDIREKIKNAHIIPNGIDTSLFDYVNKSIELRKKILIIRSFKAHNYANDLSVEAIVQLSKKDFFKDLEFSIYGEGYLFHKLTDPLQHFPNVKLHNNYVENKDIPNIHKQFGVFLCPSRLDTQGVSMCEAMSSGLVPITSEIGGIPEYAQNDVSCLFVNEAKEIADKIEFLYKNPEAFSRISANARKTVEGKCALKKTVEREVSLLKLMTRSVVEINSGYYQQCVKCILDNINNVDITFDENGVCSFCHSYELNEKQNVFKGDDGTYKLQKIVREIKASGKNKKYDCILGVSGGVDSTYLALKAKELGLRPLVIHFDNGWNSELAISNIEKIINKLNFDLYTYVVDWAEFRDLQLAFLKASVVDIEMITDHAILASLYRLAISHNVKYILSGVNYATESILPPSWIHDKRDHVHIRVINKLFGTTPLKKFPILDSILKFKVEWYGIVSIPLLNHLPYIKADVKKVIINELNWRDYGGKHYESVFTRFYQGYILIEKFGIDKRKAHLSNLICSGQLTREEALVDISSPAYPEELKRKDYDFVIKKLGLSMQEFEALMKLPPKKHSDYPVSEDLYKRYPVLNLFAPFWQFIKRTKRRI